MSLIWQTLKHSDLFSQWPDELLEALLPSARMVTYGKRELIQSGDTTSDTEDLLCVANGSLEVSFANEHGGKYIYTFAGQGIVIPILNLSGQRLPNPYSFHSLLVSDIVHISTSAIRRMLQQHPQLWQSVATVAIKRQSDSLNLLQKHMLSNTRQMIASILVHLASLNPQPARDSGTYTLDINQTDLAAMTGTTRQTVNKELRQFADEGVLRLRYGRIVVLNMKLLQAAEQFETSLKPNPTQRVTAVKD